MSDAQWMFEFHAIRQREEHDEKRVIALLGLNMLNPTQPVPLALLCGNPDMLSHAHKQLQALQDETTTTSDADFETFSLALMHASSAQKPDEIPADMQPILQPIPKFDYTTTEEYAREFAALIKPRHK